MNESRDYSTYIRAAGDGAQEMDFAVEGISCGGCIARIERVLKQVPGILNTRVNFTNRRVTVTWTPDADDAGRTDRDAGQHGIPGPSIRGASRRR